MASTKKSSKESIKEYVIMAARVLLILEMVLYTCVSTSPNRDKSQERPLSMIDESGTSSTDQENSVVHENRQFDDRGSKEAEEKAGTAIPVEQVDDVINTRGTHAPLEMYAPDEHKSSAFIKEEKEVMYDTMNKAQKIEDMLRKVCTKERKTLKAMKKRAQENYSLFLTSSKELTTAREKSDEFKKECTLASDKEDDIYREIENRSSDCNTATFQILSSEYKKYVIEKHRILLLYAKINELKQYQRRREMICKKVFMYGIEPENNMNILIEDSFYYYSNKVDIEIELGIELEYNLKILTEINNIQSMLLYPLLKSEENKDLKNNKKELIELHNTLFKYMQKEIGGLTKLYEAQKDVILKAKKLFSMYKAYNAANCECKTQEKVLDTVERILHNLEE
ncbi:hypothetical protein NEAUS05_2473 [Nematocida ausubeli]|nr:hypothetical protein NEAUS05_2473 [Nematocida ausubeli]